MGWLQVESLAARQPARPRPQPWMQEKFTELEKFQTKHFWLSEPGFFSETISSRSHAEQVYFCKLLQFRGRAELQESLSLGRFWSKLLRKTPCNYFRRVPGIKLWPRGSRSSALHLGSSSPELAAPWCCGCLRRRRRKVGTQSQERAAALPEPCLQHSSAGTSKPSGG